MQEQQSELERFEPDDSFVTRPVHAATVMPSRQEQEAASVPGPLHCTLEATLHEALTQANSERHDWIERVGEPNREITRGTYQRRADFLVSTTDPHATLMQGKGGSHLGYHTHYVVDGGKSRIILAALVTPKARDGKSADARSPLADTFSVEVASTPIRPPTRPMGLPRISSHWKSSRFARMCLCPILISAPTSLDNVIFAMMLSMMSTSVRTGRNFTTPHPVPLRTTDSIGRKQRCAMPAR